MRTRRVESGSYEVLDDEDRVVGIVYREDRRWQGQLLGCDEPLARYTFRRIDFVVEAMERAIERGGQRIVKLQPAPRTDHITADGDELTQLPYPLHVRAFSGTVLYGWADRVVGFVTDSARQEIDIHWRDYVQNYEPDDAVGKYVVIEKPFGHFATLETAVMKVEVSG